MPNTVLSSLRLRNFRCFRDVEIGLSRLNMLVGPNDSGKSTIKDAISLLLSGTATGAETGQGLAGLRSRGAAPDARWSLEAVIRRGDAAEKVSRTETEGPKSNRQALVEALTGVRGTTARACIYANELLRLDRKAAQRLVLDLIPREEVELDPPTRALILDTLQEEHSALDLATAERLYRAAYEARTAAGRDVAAIGSLGVPAAPDGLVGAAEMPVSELSATLDAMRDKLAKLRKQREVALAKAAPRTMDTRPAQAALDRARREVEAAEKASAEIPEQEAVVAEIQAVQAKLDEAVRENERIVEERRRLSEQLADQKAAAKRAEAALKVLREQPEGAGKCPLCEKKLSDKDKLVGKLLKSYEGASRQVQIIGEKLGLLPEGPSTRLLEQQLADLEAIPEMRRRGEEAALRALGMLETAEKALRDLPASEPGNPEAEQEAEALAQRIEAGQAKADALSAYLGARRHHEGAAEKLRAAQARHSRLDAAVQALGPGGIRKQIGGGGLVKFQVELNALLFEIGYSVDLRPLLDLEDDPLVSHGGVTVPARMLSRSGAIRFSAAFAVAVARWSGLGLVVVDDFEALELANRRTLWSLLDGSGLQVFILAVQTAADYSTTAAQQNASSADVSWLWVHDGQIEKPGAVAA